MERNTFSPETEPINQEELEKTVDELFEASDLAIHALMRKIADRVKEEQ